jgi:two-component system nitrate/nitrite response regulator NarL
MIRILIADDHPLVLRGVEGLFDPADYQVVATCADGAAALEQIQAGGCDIAVIDLNMPGRTGLDILREVRRTASSVRIVLLTATIDDASLVEAINCGVDGLVLKETAAELLVKCVESVRQGVPWIDRSAMSRALRVLAATESRPAGARLTSREGEVAGFVAAGMRNKEIADRAGISEGTVKMHLHNIYEKLGIGTRTELAIYVRDVGLA